MKLLTLNEKEKKKLTKLLSMQVRKGCEYEISNILEKLSVAEYERAFGIMDDGRCDIIKRCPFCGGVPTLSKESCGDTFYYYVKCKKCNAEINMPKFEECEAVSDWNRRVILP